MHSPERISSIERRIVLVGAGNAHLLFVRRWGMKPLPGVAVALVNDTATVPYSAMVPGSIAGEYDRAEMRIDLVRLCATNGVRLIAEPITRLDISARRIQFANRPSLGFDILSLGLGSIPTLPPGAEQFRWSLTLRPLSQLLSQLDRLESDLQHSFQPFHLVVVGGGASGCELTLAIRKRFARFPKFRLSLVHSGSRLLPHYPARTAAKFASELQAHGIAVRLNARVVQADSQHLFLDNGVQMSCDGVLWATNAAPPRVLQEAGLSLDARGFLLVHETLQTATDPHVFGTGDCVAFPAYPNLPRNGVMAVRQGRVLHDNIVALLNKRPLISFRPQKRWLSLLNTANGEAVAGYGSLATAGRWARRLKDRIDRSWTAKFAGPPLRPGSAVPPMRCGGCGSKVPADVLASALRRLTIPGDPRVLVGCQAGEDGAVFRTESPSVVEVQTVDFFRSFVDDPYLFGQIAALHAVSDLDAMNARPFAALAIATLPYARGSIQSDLLGELLEGANTTLRRLGVVLAGGHTTEGAELAVGFAVTGHANPARLFRKDALRPGDLLLLTKPLGTGALLAAWTRGSCQSEWFEAATRSMLIANRGATEVFDRHDVRACTDVTGFGLAGHLLEMLDASKVSARIDRAAVPILEGFRDVVSAGIVSSLHEGNARLGCRIAAPSPLPAWLFDPQTSGGLLAGVHPTQVESVLLQLHDHGTPAAVIGKVLSCGSGPPTLDLH
jgi:selenide,water dikinase